MRNCLDEGMLQGYIDGELSAASMDEAAAHIAACLSCADAAREAENEMASFTAAFAHEASVNVPTERLRDHIEAAIDQRQLAVATPAPSSFNRLCGALTALLTLTPQRAAAFASLALVITLAVLFAAARPDKQTPEATGEEGGGNEIAAVAPALENQNSTATETTPPFANAAPEQSVSPAIVSSGGATIVKASVNKPRGVRRSTNTTPSARGRETLTTTTTTAPKLLPGEGSYLEAIASLTKAIDAGGDATLRPSVRSEYERNLAVVDQAILTTRRNALRNPQDTGAREFLLSAYQTKVELLNTVADQTQLATLGR